MNIHLTLEFVQGNNYRDFFSIYKLWKELSSGHLHTVSGPIPWVVIKSNLEAYIARKM